MFKSCCVCMSKKVIENENHPSGAAAAVGRGDDAGLEGLTGAVVPPLGAAPHPARGDKVNGVDSREKSLSHSVPEIRAGSDEGTKIIENEFNVCAEIKEEIQKLQTVDECDTGLSRNPAMERDAPCLMTSIPEAGSSPSEQSSGKESIPDSEDNAVGRCARAAVVDADSRTEENDSAVSFGTREETQDSDDEESDASDREPPEGIRRASSGGILKRPSIAWPAEEKPRVEGSDDDDVFCAPPASVLAARKQSLPAGLGGGAVGRDELALRRHRVFSELVGAARAAAEHRVRFDPLGPLVATENIFGSKKRAESQISPHVSPADLERLLDRLERVVNRLERVAGVPPPSPPPPPPVPAEDSTEESGTASPSSPSANSQIDSESQETSKMSVQGYQDIMQGPLAQYISLSNQIGGDVATHANLVQKAFQAQLQYLTLASQSAQPAASQQQALLTPTSQQIQAIQEFREKNRVSPLFNHLSAISESIPALGWVAVSPTPAPYVKEMNDAGQFYTNRVLKDWKEKDKKHVDWCKSWIQTLQELQAFVKQQHTTGLVWAGSGSCPPPPPCGMPPPPPCPPPVVDFGADLTGDERTALFAQINQGEDITKSLKKVTSDMQTHKNTTLREGPAPFRAPVVAPKPFAKTLPTAGAGQIDKPPVFNRDGKKWLIEYQKGNQGLMVENAEMNNVVYMFKCRDSALTVKGKINSIVLDSCTKCAVVFDSLVSSVEFVNCQSVQMQVLGKVPTVSIDKTDGCQMYLSEDSLNAEIVSSKSSEMNVLVPKGNGDYTELPIPEQFKTTLNKASSSLTTVAIESKG